MDLNEWIQIALAVGTVLAAVMAWVAVKRDSRRETTAGSEMRIRELAKVTQEPLKDQIAINGSRLDQMRESVGRIETTLLNVDNNVHDTRERLASVESLQRQHIETITMSLMKLIHQPDPRRGRIDHLLELYMEGAISPEEVTDLKKILVSMRNVEPGENQVEESIRTLGFPVYPGEQTNAAILLGTMDFVDPTRLSRYGHSEHRSTAHRQEN